MEFTLAMTLEILAEQGDLNSQVHLSSLYYHGTNGTPQNYSEAAKWLTRAAEQGSAQSQAILGFMYSNAQGVEQDYQEAIRLYRLAAEQGDENAQHNLGTMYGNGDGVAEDYVRAYMWFDIAASNGYYLSPEAKEIAAKDMTPAQIEEAKKMAQECIAKNYKDC